MQRFHLPKLSAWAADLRAALATSAAPRAAPDAAAFLPPREQLAATHERLAAMQTRLAAFCDALQASPERFEELQRLAARPRTAPPAAAAPPAQSSARRKRGRNDRFLPDAAEPRGENPYERLRALDPTAPSARNPYTITAPPSAPPRPAAPAAAAAPPRPAAKAAAPAPSAPSTSAGEYVRHKDAVAARKATLSRERIAEIAARAPVIPPGVQRCPGTVTPTFRARLTGTSSPLPPQVTT